MYRLCLAVVVALTLLIGFNTASAKNVQISDEGCFDGGAAYDFQRIHRIVIWEDDRITHLEEIPCGSGVWSEKSSGIVRMTPPGGGNLGTFTPWGTVEFTGVASSEAGVITPGSGPTARGFTWLPATTTLIISAPVVASLLASL